MFEALAFDRVSPEEFRTAIQILNDARDAQMILKHALDVCKGRIHEPIMNLPRALRAAR